MSPLLETEGLALVRGGRMLFQGLDLCLGEGEALHLSGPNGSGKTSLLRVIAGLLLPASGRVRRAPAALADEQLALDRELPLGRALAFWKGPNLGEAIEAFGLHDLVRVPVRHLSTGQAKRAMLARTMASGAPLWLLDEPLNGLDRTGADGLAAAISGHRARGGGVVAASHLPMAGPWAELELGR